MVAVVRLRLERRLELLAVCYQLLVVLWLALELAQQELTLPILLQILLEGVLVWVHLQEQYQPH
jgi:hypothetical protein